MYRENYVLASNYADKVLLFKKSMYLDMVDEKILKFDNYAYVPEIREWFRLEGYRKAGDGAEQAEFLRTVLSEWMRKPHAAFVMSKRGGELRIIYGSGGIAADAGFKAVIPEAVISDYHFGDENYNYSGLVTGSLKAKAVADVYASSGIGSSYVALVKAPMSDIDVQAKINENRQLYAFLDSHKSTQRVYGNATRRVEEVPLQNIVQALNLIREENEYIGKNQGSGFVRAALRFGAESLEDYHALKSLILSSLISEEEVGFEPQRCFDFNHHICGISDMLAIPYVELGSGSAGVRMYALSMQDIKSSCSFCLPPGNSHVGFYVRNYDVSERDLEAFPVVRALNTGGVGLGSIKKSHETAIIPYTALHSHAFVTGATETGKTTTVKKILLELYKSKIPFTVIEAAKKEYISLINHVPELKVYTPGNDGEMLAVNPLQAEDGVLIESHVAAVVRAMVSAMGGEHPIPEALHGLLKQTYRSKGWTYGSIAYTDETKPFPTFRDVFDNIDSYIENHADYGLEVKQNLRAALKLRVDTMCSGAMEYMFNRKRGLSAKDILESPSVIELSDFSSESADFLMNILLFKFQSYLSRLQENPNLSRVVVIEEAHNIFKHGNSEDNGKALNNEYFDKMLSEIRSSGTGLILSDQRASLMSDAVIANTSVKIIHNIVSAEDRKLVGAACNMTDFQQKKLGELDRGECLLYIRGNYGLSDVNVSAVSSASKINPSCHVCSARFRCKRDEVINRINNKDKILLSYHISKILSNPYNTEVLKENIDNMMKSIGISSSDDFKLCLLGELLSSYASSSTQEKRIICTFYANYLKKGAKYE